MTTAMSCELQLPRPRRVFERAINSFVARTATVIGSGRALTAGLLIATALGLSGCIPWIMMMIPRDPPPDPPFEVNNGLDAAIAQAPKSDRGISVDEVRIASTAYLKGRFPPDTMIQDVLDYFSDIGGTCAPGPNGGVYDCEYCKVAIKGVVQEYNTRWYARYDFLWRVTVFGRPSADGARGEAQVVDGMILRLARPIQRYPPDWGLDDYPRDCPYARRQLDDPSRGGLYKAVRLY
jgi:hypothetical protein